MNEVLSILFAALGLVIGWLAASQKAKTDIIRAEERLAAVEHGRETLTAQMESVATQVSRQNSEDFLKLAEERLGKVNAEAEKDRSRCSLKSHPRRIGPGCRNCLLRRLTLKGHTWLYRRILPQVNTFWKHLEEICLLVNSCFPFLFFTEL